MNDEILYAVCLDAPSDDLPTYWISKCGGDGPGWTISPSKAGRLKIPKHDAERIMARLPLVAQLRVEQGWTPALARIGRKKSRRRKERSPRATESAPARTARMPRRDSPLELLRDLEALRVRATELCVELDVDSPAGFWTGDVQGRLAMIVRQGAQLILGEESPA